MKASRVGSLSPRLVRWAGLLAITALPLAAGACVAQTGTSEGEGHGVTDDHSKVSAGGDIVTAGGSDPGSKADPQQRPPVGPGPVFGPIPSPWDPQPSNDNPGDLGTGNGTGAGAGAGNGSENGGESNSMPVPSPWLDQGATSAATQQSVQPSTAPTPKSN
jgi:hypothetical protein